jgi:hypothetical protein
MALDATITSDDDDEPSALEDAFVRYQENGLRLPPVPRDLVDELDEFADWRWGSEDLNLENRDEFLAQAAVPGGDREIGFGHVGHGVSSWWLCYRLKIDALAVYVRLAYGGVYEDSSAAVAEANEISAGLEELIPATEAAKAAGRLRGGHRLIVVVDDKQGGFWEIAGGPDGRHESDNPLDDAIGFLSHPVLLDPAP